MSTIRQVAADAGVAASTVSYVLSGNKKLPDATVQKVLASVAKLGYRPSSAARALALGRTNVLGMLAAVSTEAPDTDVDIFMRFVRAAMYAARPHGYDVLVMGRGDDELLGDVLADALLVMDVRADEQRIPVLRERGLTSVLVGVPQDAQGFSTVDLDFEEAARLMVRHLAARGHRELAVLGPPDEDPGQELAYRWRFRRGFADECGRRGLQGRYRPCGTGPAEVAQWLATALREQPGLSGILVMGVASLAGLLRELGARGLSVPRDVSLLAVAPEEEFAQPYPQVSVVDLPGRAMIGAAVEQVLAELGGAPGGARIVLPAVLHERGSTARAPGADSSRT